MIVKVIVGMAMGRKVQDTRSEEEPELEECENSADMKMKSSPFTTRQMRDLDSSEAKPRTGCERNMDITDVNVCVGSTNAITPSVETSMSVSTYESSRGGKFVRSRSEGLARRRRRIPGLLDREKRKELLARIGCETTIQ